MDKAINEIKQGIHLILNGLDELQQKLVEVNSRVNYLTFKDDKNEQFFNQLENLLKDRKN